MPPGFLPPSLGPIPTYQVIWVVFLLFPPSLLILRFLGKFRLPVWLLLLLFTILGWALVNLATWLYFDYLAELANSLPAGPEKSKIREKWAADGAKLTGALFGGWMVSLFYFLFCLIILWIVKIFFRKLSPAKLKNHFSL